jgi:hypothetical protein
MRPVMIRRAARQVQDAAAGASEARWESRGPVLNSVGRDFGRAGHAQGKRSVAMGAG